MDLLFLYDVFVRVFQFFGDYEIEALKNICAYFNGNTVRKFINMSAKGQIVHFPFRCRGKRLFA